MIYTTIFELKPRLGLGLELGSDSESLRIIIGCHNVLLAVFDVKKTQFNNLYRYLSYLCLFVSICVGRNLTIVICKHACII